MLSFTSPREAFFACPPLPSCSLHSFTVEPTLSFHAPALIPLSLARVRLSLTLILSDLTIWCIGQTAPFLFLLEKAALAYLSTAFSVALRPLFPFQQVQYARVFPPKPAPFCKQALCWSRKHQQVCHFSSYLTLATLSSPPSFLLLHSLWQELSTLSFCSIRLQWVPGHDSADELARLGALLVPSAIPCSLSPLIHTFLGLQQCLFDTQVPWISTCLNLYSLVVFSLVFAATDTAYS